MTTTTETTATDRFANLRSEFSDYDISTLPAIPEGWDDVSWHNDACPSFQIPDTPIRVWINYADSEIEKREFEMRGRFAVITEDEHADEPELLATDDWNAVLQLVGELTCENHRDTGRGVCAHCGKVMVR